MSEKLNQFWEQWALKLEALNAREKRLVLGAAFVLLYGIYTVLIEPAEMQLKKINQEIQKNTAEIHTLELQLNMMTQKTMQPQASEEERRIRALNDSIAALSTKIDHLKGALIDPNKMPDLLSDLLADNPDLNLVSLETLAPTDLFETTEKAGPPQGAAVFKHGVEMTIEGRYLDLMAYLAKLEKMPWHILWENASLDVEKEPETAYPISKLKLVVYSLSLDKAWLAI